MDKSVFPESKVTVQLPEGAAIPKQHSYADAPVSIAELRSDRTQSCTDWTPRDALIHVLRHLDKEKPDVDTLIVCWREKDGGEAKVKFRLAAPGVLSGLGLLAYVTHKIIE